ncbi:hypothetical protein NLG97_g11134 [Lecanicillium saksenae]|uniref:Uncharacterized protein n=1 Tax=Lecanicillium saksenae TaxID=468837 RepID=A0ACC1QBR3_9HYPO|nr:hypothetical protein NLG97_g11134 [Lecanicillium saksenae]
MGDDQAAELDALLGASLVKKQQQPKEEGDGVKKEEEEEEEEENDGSREERVKMKGDLEGKLEPDIKEEPDSAAGGITETPAKSEDADAAVGAVVFKKRKPKGLRTK